MEGVNTLKKNASEKSGIQGIVTFTKYKIVGKRAEEIDKELKTATNISQARYNELVRELNELCEVTAVRKENLCVLSGRSIFARLLVGDTTYTGEINYGALGSNSTAVDASDTTLNTEVARKLYATRVRSGAQVTLDFYYSKSDTNGTYEEFGCFIDGSASADSGQLFNRLLTGGWTKSASEAMTVSVQININAA